MIISYYYKFIEDAHTLYWAAGPNVGMFVEASEIPRGRPVISVADRAALVEILNHYGFPLGVLAGPDELVKQFEQAVAARLDYFAREKQYDNMDKARLAALSSDFKTDGEFANQVYDQVWTAAIPLMTKIRAGANPRTRAAALTLDEALAQLPAIQWPALIQPDDDEAKEENNNER